jgi:hypothetical protein
LKDTTRIAGTPYNFSFIRRQPMLLSTTTIEDFDRWMNVFTTTSAEKRKKYGSKGALVFRDLHEADRVWVVSTGISRVGRTSSPIPRSPMLKAAGHKSKAQSLTLAGECGA